MGERGPLQKPNARRRNAREVAGHVSVARPTKPRSLTGEAAAEWNRIVPELERSGILSTIDRALLVRYCTAWADWVELDALLAQGSKIVRGQKGNLVRSPAWLMRRNAEQTLAELGRQLGLTPVSRLRAGITHELPAQPSEDTNDQRVTDFAAERRRRLTGAG
ncbi:MAG: phage terminase small subunit P27 family [Dehalococcoidia bacterium]|nr:phage terminase small subunit P27 family [Dehalococcoidia bacterium]